MPGQAAGEAAGGQVAAVGGDILSPGQRRAVEALGRAWGDGYDIGCTRVGVYYARRGDGTGEALEAPTPDALDAAIRADQETCHV